MHITCVRCLLTQLRRVDWAQHKVVLLVTLHSPQLARVDHKDLALLGLPLFEGEPLQVLRCTMKVAPKQQQAPARIAAHLAPVAQLKDLIPLGEGMNDGRALAICVAQLGTPKVPRAQVVEMSLRCR